MHLVPLSYVPADSNVRVLKAAQSLKHDGRLKEGLILSKADALHIISDQTKLTNRAFVKARTVSLRAPPLLTHELQSCKARCQVSRDINSIIITVVDDHVPRLHQCTIRILIAPSLTLWYFSLHQPMTDSHEPVLLGAVNLVLKLLLRRCKGETRRLASLVLRAGNGRRLLGIAPDLVKKHNLIFTLW